MDAHPRHLAGIGGGLLLLLALGFLWPLVWPRQQITLLGVLAFLFGLTLAIFGFVFTDQQLGPVAGIAAVALANAATVCLWLIAVCYVTAWLRPTPP